VEWGESTGKKRHWFAQLPGSFGGRHSVRNGGKREGGANGQKIAAQGKKKKKRQSANYSGTPAEKGQVKKQGGGKKKKKKKKLCRHHGKKHETLETIDEGGRGKGEGLFEERGETKKRQLAKESTVAKRPGPRRRKPGTGVVGGQNKKKNEKQDEPDEGEPR